MICLLAAAPADAGGGPENLFLVVNAESESSLTIANHYVAWRRIPACNVLHLKWTGSRESVEIETFRREILLPALKAIDQRGLSDQIEYLVYSSDLPWSINAQGDYRGTLKSPLLTPTVSINAATYLWQFTLAGRGLVSLANNPYYSPAEENLRVVTRGFPSELALKPPRGDGPPLPLRCLLSTMLAVTSGRGATEAEALAGLRRSVEADHTRPTGTVYFVKNRNIRSTTRDWAFSAAVEELKLAGVAAEVVEGVLPLRKIDVQGLTIGASDFDWPKSRCTLLPGAICDNLTSFGGDLRKDAGQTPLSEFIRHGAAGASGTIVEPYAVQAKFPTAAVHVHYARGCSLAEAFYQAVAAPFQLLIVGDPLCQPWAVAPQVTLPNIKAGQTLRGTVELRPEAATSGERRIETFEIFLDGRRAARFAPGESWNWDTKQFAAGHHELRVVAIDASPIRSQGRLILPVVVDNGGQPVELRSAAAAPLRQSDRLRVELSAPGADEIVLLHGAREVGRVREASGAVEIPLPTLGRGPVELHAQTTETPPRRSAPLRFQIE